MSRVYDNWERLVEATLKREELRRVAMCHSFSSSSSSVSTEFLSFDSALVDASALSTPSISFSLGVRSIASEELRKATGNFRPDLRIGEGTSGSIYKGWFSESTFTAAKGFMRRLLEPKMAVAIKKWGCHTEHDCVRWSAECKYLSQLDHPNIVKLVGYCSERDDMALVYEYMPKRSLSHLFGRGLQALSWDTRMRVALGAARGLSFLHDREIPIIHGDFHSQHILLDKDYNVKLSGFGLAKDGLAGDVAVGSAIIEGTYGFASPEYIMTGSLSTKCDVHAFGAVLLELLSGRRVFDLMNITAIEEDAPEEWHDTVKIYTNDETKLRYLMDSQLKGQYTPNEARTVLTLGIQCLSSNPELRPRMAEVSLVLQQLLDSRKDNQDLIRFE